MQLTCYSCYSCYCCYRVEVAAVVVVDNEIGMMMMMDSVVAE